MSDLNLSHTIISPSEFDSIPDEVDVRLVNKALYGVIGLGFKETKVRWDALAQPERIKDSRVYTGDGVKPADTQPTHGDDMDIKTHITSLAHHLADEDADRQLAAEHGDGISVTGPDSTTISVLWHELDQVDYDRHRDEQDVDPTQAQSLFSGAYRARLRARAHDEENACCCR